MKSNTADFTHRSLESPSFGSKAEAAFSNRLVTYTLLQLPIAPASALIYNGISWLRYKPLPFCLSDLISLFDFSEVDRSPQLKASVNVKCNTSFVALHGERSRVLISNINGAVDYVHRIAAAIIYRALHYGNFTCCICMPDNAGCWTGVGAIGTWDGDWQ